ncbi:MAG TPA: hypothetical protein ENK49_14305 [Gammaproteobacteria bacterium]|nr:hypothetical protein [Gammaproteobacteria bacterium]
MDKIEKQAPAGPAVVITGAHSGIGQQLIERLAGSSTKVLGLVTPWCNTGGLVLSEQVEYLPCDLREPLPPAMAERCRNGRILVHLAWARPKSTFDAIPDNVKIFNHIRAALPDGVKTVYMSSVCATPANPANYGQAKYHLGQQMDPANTVEIIAGLLRSEPAIGPYLALQDFVCKLHARFMFLPSPLALVARPEQVMDALVNAVLNFDACPRILPAYDPEPVRLNDLIANILAEKGITGIPLPVPTGLVLGLLYLARRLVPGVPISDRLITLLTVSPSELAARIEAETKTDSIP